MSACLDENQVAELLEGRASAAARDRADAHIADCASCRRLVGAAAPLRSNPSAESEAPAPRLAVAGASIARYRVLRTVGAGGMGVVYAAHDPTLSREVAIKVLRDGGRGSLADRFRREVQITARLQHPSIVPVHEVGHLDTGELYCVMKLISGRSLHEVVQRTGSFDQRLALVPHVVASADAVAYAHAQRIIHRDLKPENIMVGAFGETLIIDWGLAKALDEGDPAGDSAPPSQPELTRSGDVVGTPSFMPPEQARGDAVDERADVYALGALLYYLLTAEPPYRGKRSDEILEAIRNGPPPLVEAREPGVPVELAAIVRKAMARDPGGRYASAEALAAELRRFSTGQLVGAHRYSTATLVRRWIARNRRMVAVAGAALAVVGITAVVSVQRIRIERDGARAAQLVAEEERSDLLLLQARAWAEKRPTEAIAYLESYAGGRAPDWSQISAVAADARSRVVARHLFGGLASPRLSPDGGHAAGLLDGRLVVVDTLRGIATPAGPPDAKVWALSDRRLVTAGRDHQIRDFALDGSGDRALGAVGEDVSSVSTSRDGRWIVAATASGALDLFDGTGGHRALRGHTAAVRCVAFSADGELVVSASEDRTARIWSLRDGSQRRVLDVRGEGCAISPDAATIAIGTLEGEVALFDVATGARRALAGHKAAVERVAFTPDGASLVSTADEGDVRVWDVRTGASRVLPSDDTMSVSLAVAPDGRRMATADPVNMTVRVWDLELGESLLLSGYEEAIQSLAFSADGRYLVTADEGGGVRVWEPPAPPRLAHTSGTTEGLVAVGEDEVWAVGGQTLRHFDGRGNELARIEGLGAHEMVAASPDGRVVVSAGEGNALLLVRSGRAPMSLTGSTGPINAAAVSADGSVVAGGGEDRVVRAWDARDGHLLRAFEGHLKNVWVLALSPDGKWLASAAGDEHRLMLWNVADGSRRELPTGDDGRVTTVAFSPDGKWLAWTGGDDRVRLWSLETQQPRTLSGHHGTVLAVLFSPDSRSLVSGGRDHAVRLWSLADGTARLFPHDGAVFLLRFSADGKRLLISGNRDAQLWDTEAGVELAVVRAERSTPADATVTGDGHHVVAAFEGESLLRLSDVAEEQVGSRAWLDGITSARLGAAGEVRSPLLVSP